MRIGAVALAVADLSRSIDFYERMLGLRVLWSDERSAELGASPGSVELRLTQIDEGAPAPATSTGLFHVAWLHPSRAALAETVMRLARGRWSIDGASDHGVSEALYLSDADGLGIEIYADRPREQWQPGRDGHAVNMGTMPLDVQDLLAQSPGDAGERIDPGTVVGHVHMKVSDVPRAAAFYRDPLGFSEQAQMPSAAFLAADGYHHHVGLNSWHSRGGARAPDSAPGLRAVDFVLSGPAAVEALEKRVSEFGEGSARRGADGRLEVLDRDGQPLRFGAARADQAPASITP